MPQRSSLLLGLAIGFGSLQTATTEVDACTRVFWNTLPDLKVVAVIGEERLLS